MRRDPATMRHLGAEDGFTLIELLASMFIFSAFMVGVVVLFTTVFHTTTSTNSRVAATEQSQVKLDVIVHDLRNSVTCNAPAALTDGTTGVFVTTASSKTTFQFCDPVAGYQVPTVTSANTNLEPATAVVTWTCNATGVSGTCQRCITTVATSTTTIPASCSSTTATGATVLTNTIVGVQQFSLSGLSAPALTTGTTTTTTPSLVSLSGDYALGADEATATVTNVLSWVGVSAEFLQLEQAGTTPRIVPGTTPIALQTGAALRNFGV